MNKYAAYPQDVPGGFRAMIRMCRDSRPAPVMEKGEKPKVFDTEGAAWKEIALHLLAFMNGHEIRGERFDGDRLTDYRNQVEAIFTKGKRIQIERIGE